jgi:hypothetical protein
MNAKQIATTLIASLLAAASATTPAAVSRMQAVIVDGAFEVSCAAPRVPGQQQVARDFGIANLGQAYDLRIRLQHVVTRACHTGADRVRITLRQPASAHETLRYVALRD